MSHPEFGKARLGDRATVMGCVVHQRELAVGSASYVHLDGIAAELECGDHRGDGVLRVAGKVPAAVSDHQWGIHGISAATEREPELNVTEMSFRTRSSRYDNWTRALAKATAPGQPRS